MIKDKGEGSVRKLDNNKFECVIQSKYLNPKTGKPKRIKRVGKTEKEAIQNAKMARDAWEKDFEFGRDTKVSNKITFGECMEEYLDEIVKPTITASGYYSYNQSMKRYFYRYNISSMQLAELNIAQFERYYKELLTNYARKTVAVPIQLTKRCSKWLVGRSLLKEDYAEIARVPKDVADEYDAKKDADIKSRKKVFTPEDISKFYYAYKNNMSEYPVVALFLLETGLRASEFAALRLDNVDLEKGKIIIVEAQAIRYKENDKDKGIEFYTKVPKNKKERFIMLSDLAKECVAYMIEQTKIHCKNNKDNLLYPSFRSGKRRSNSTMEIGFKNLCNMLDIDRDVHTSEHGYSQGLCLHSLRHTADTIANTAKGANVVNTALMMGHTAIRTENVYTHATEEALSSITTPSQAVLEDYKKEEEIDMAEFEEFRKYLELKRKFEMQ